jgi:hypothetical protein
MTTPRPGHTPDEARPQQVLPRPRRGGTRLADLVGLDVREGDQPVPRRDDYVVGGFGPGVPEPLTKEQVAEWQARFDEVMLRGGRWQWVPDTVLMPPGPVTHIAGTWVEVGSRLRQLCAWCGYRLVDYDLARIAVPEGQDPRPGTWAPGDLVRVDGNVSMTVEHEDGAELPADACERQGVLESEASG